MQTKTMTARMQTKTTTESVDGIRGRPRPGAPRGPDPGGSRRERWVVSLLSATFLVVVVLFVQGLRTLRAQRAMVETTLEDLAASAADRIAADLDRRFVAYFLTEIARARDAHYRWVTAPDEPSERPTARYPLPDGTIRTFFSLDDTLLVVHGPEVDASTRRSIVEQVRGHLSVYPPPAPYAVLRSDRPTAIVYRRDEAYDRASVYGFVVDFSAPVSIYERTVERAELLPRSLGDEAASRDLFAVAIHLAPDAPALYARDLPAGSEGPEAWAFAGKAGRLAVRTRIAADAAAASMTGAGGVGSLPLLSALALLTAGLLYAAIVLLRRSSRLAALRESFVANVSHDLRTPITQIRMFAESLRLDRLDDASDRRRALEIVHRQTEILEDLVDNLLHASGSHAAIQPVPTDLESLATDVVDGLEPSAAARASHVELTVLGPAEAVVDPMAFTRILTNLLDNAIRHGEPGGRIAVTVEHRNGVTLTVDDDGPGIRPGDRERVFHRFERLDRPGSTATGAGIGLSVVRSLAEQQGGRVHVEEAPRGGARVVVHLPLPPTPNPSPASGRPRRNASGAGAEGS